MDPTKGVKDVVLNLTICLTLLVAGCKTQRETPSEIPSLPSPEDLHGELNTLEESEVNPNSADH